MPKSKIDKLPRELREALERRLDAEDFEDYGDLAAWLQEQGHNILRENIAVYVRKRKRQPPGLADIRRQLEREGVSVVVDDTELHKLLVKLGALRLRESVLLTRLLALGVPGPGTSLRIPRGPGRP